ncbi:MAG: toll/interleukin-1 receptor domain-containing protein [Lachnospiraceae bacterium]|nr:toll/interleukin-1 receptor domain-containing protein [Lachnospiraceae bacterium]
MNKQYKFDAFISYRHTEPDQFAAQLLHKRLEAFKLPKNVVSKLGEGGRTKISRVFRDQEELPLASNLADTITEALNESDFLIVICTPRLPESRWCRKEITTFLENHDRTHVLAVLLEGEPEQSFPEELRFIDEVVTHEDGTTETVRREIEPLAADFRGATHKEIAKKMDLEILRLLAPMFGVDFDDLRQRHRERKMKRIIRISAAISTVFFAFALVSTTMALRINKQNIEIQNKNSEIQEQNEEITEQNLKIEEQYQEVLRSESTILATRSASELEEGDRLKAVKTALEALPQDAVNPDRPVVAAAQYALSQALYAYDNGAAFRPQMMLETQTTTSSLILSPNASKILATDQAGNLYVWEGTTGKMLAHFTSTYSFFNEETEALWLDEDRIALLFRGGFGVVSISGKNVVYEKTGDSVYNLFSDWDCKVLAAETYRYVSFLDAETGEELARFDHPENYTCTDIYFSGEGYAAIAYNVDVAMREEVGRNSRIDLIDLSTFEVIRSIERKGSLVDRLLIREGSIFAGYTSTRLKPDVTDETPSAQKYDYFAHVENIDPNTGNARWSKEVDTTVKRFYTARDGSWDYILVRGSQEAIFLEKATGKLISSKDYEYNIADVAFNDTGDICTFITSDGQRHLVQPYKDSDTVYIDTFLSPTDSVKAALFGDGFVALRPTNSNRLYLMNRSEGVGYEPVWENIASSCLSAQFSDDGTRLLSYSGATDNHMDLVDLTTGEVISSMNRDSTLDVLTLLGDGNEKVVLFKKSPSAQPENEEDDPGIPMGTMVYYSVKDGSELESIEPDWTEELSSIEVLAVSRDRTKIKFRTTEGYARVCKVVDLATNTVDATWYMPEERAMVYDLSDDGTLGLAVLENEGTLNLYHATGDPEKDMEPAVSVSVNTAFMESAFISSDKKYVGVTYKNHETELYDAKDLSLIRSLGILEYSMNDMAQYADGYYLTCNLGAYLLDEELNLKCWVRGFKALTPDGNSAYVTNTFGDIYKTKLYSLQELIDFGKKLLTETGYE